MRRNGLMYVTEGIEWMEEMNENKRMKKKLLKDTKKYKNETKKNRNRKKTSKIIIMESCWRKKNGTKKQIF